ncbi:MAG: hypothetical protein Q6368_007440 [Candidatus Baldrarchaeota archaeon]|nr:hypothetical protein [Candidatus Baldrarchaeota archaeon]
MCNEENLKYISNSVKENILRAVREKLQHLKIEDAILDELKSVAKEVFEKRLATAINDIDFPLLLKTVLREILEPIILRSIEDAINDKLFILKLIDKSRKSSEL